MKKSLPVALFLSALFLIVLILVFFVLREPPQPAAPASTPLSTNPLETLSLPSGSHTSTPFQPSSPTATTSPTLVPSLTATSVVPPTALPYDHLYPPVDEDSYLPMPLIPEPKGQITILVLGTDLISGRNGYRTDGIILVTINTRKQEVTLTSFPRDLFVLIPGWTVQRINTAYPHGGFEMMADTLEFNFGVRPDYFALVHVTFLEDVVTDLGGIEVQVQTPLCDHRAGYKGDYCVPSGTVFMDGPTALWYARSRNSRENDFGRNRRHQEILRAVFNRMMELDSLTKVPQLYKTYQKNVETNLTLGTILNLIPTAAKLRDPSRLQQYYITREEIIPWTTPKGAMVLIPQPKPIRELLIQALNSPED
jgi:LCP family protein required for cell wall assembly